MAKFECNVVVVEDVLEHPNADKLEIIKVGGYSIVSGVGNWKKGDVAVYLPENSILPLAIQEQLDVVGFLSGSNKDRLKAIKLRGELSEGMLLPIDGLGDVKVGDDVSELIGVSKYVVVVPASFGGDVIAVHEKIKPTNFDVENIKKQPNWIGDGEMVDITEKIHGTYCQMILVNNRNARLTNLDGFLQFPSAYQAGVTSKGMGAKGLAMNCNSVNNDNNVYVQALKRDITNDLIQDLFEKALPRHVIQRIASVQIMGEVYGAGVQDLQYDGVAEKKFRVFDIRYRSSNGKFNEYLSPDEVRSVCNLIGLEVVPSLYTGRFSYGVLQGNTYGASELASGQIKEGCVVRLVDRDRKTYKGSRIILKSVSEQYLTRKSKSGKEPTEYN